MTIKVLVEVLDRRGRLEARHVLAFEYADAIYTVGRSVAADIPIDDEHLAPIHATIAVSASGAIELCDFGSLNGIRIDGKQVPHDKPVEVSGRRIVLGTSELRLRSSRDSLPPEKPLRHASLLQLRPWQLAIFCAGLGAGYIAYETWLSTYPRFAEAFVTASAGFAIAVVVWSSIWALGTRVIRSEWRWLQHLAITMLVGLAAIAIAEAISLGAFAMGLRLWPDYETWLMGAAATALIYFHLSQATTIRPQPRAIVSCALPIVAVAGIVWMGVQTERRNVNLITPIGRVYPSHLRLASPTPLDRFFTEAAHIRADADEKRATAVAEDPDGTMSF